MELSLLSRGILTRLADPFLRNCPETAGKSLAARRVEHPQRRPPIRKDFQRALPLRIWFLKRWGRFSLACRCVPPEFRRAAQSSISTSSRRGALGLGGVRERLRFGGGGFGGDLILVGFAVDAKLHFVSVEGEFNRGMDGHVDGVVGLYVTGGERCCGGWACRLLALSRAGPLLSHL